MCFDAAAFKGQRAGNRLSDLSRLRRPRREKQQQFVSNLRSDAFSRTVMFTITHNAPEVSSLKKPRPPTEQIAEANTAHSPRALM